LRYLPSCWR